MNSDSLSVNRSLSQFEQLLLVLQLYRYRAIYWSRVFRTLLTRTHGEYGISTHTSLESWERELWIDIRVDIPGTVSRGSKPGLNARTTLRARAYIGTSAATDTFSVQYTLI